MASRVKLLIVILLYFSPIHVIGLDSSMPKKGKKPSNLPPDCLSKGQPEPRFCYDGVKFPSLATNASKNKVVAKREEIYQKFKPAASEFRVPGSLSLLRQEVRLGQGDERRERARWRR